jgi:hypothetical protein
VLDHVEHRGRQRLVGRAPFAGDVTGQPGRCSRTSGWASRHDGSQVKET